MQLDIHPLSDHSPLVSVFAPALEAARQPHSPACLAATFGEAFCFSMNPDGGAVWQRSGIDWGYYLGALGELGCEVEVLSGSVSGADKKGPAEMVVLMDTAWERARASIGRGVPAIAWTPMTVAQRDAGVGAQMWGLLAGYDDERQYTVHHRKAEPYTVAYDGFGHCDPVEWFCVMLIGEPREEEAAERHRRILANALRFLRGERNAAEGAQACGYAAFELWLAAIEAGTVDRREALRHTRFLRTSRTYAVEYLRETALEILPGPALLGAAEAWAEEVALVTRLEHAFEEPLEEVQGELRTILKQALEAERRAGDALSVVVPD